MMLGWVQRDGVDAEECQEHTSIRVSLSGSQLCVAVRVKG